MGKVNQLIIQEKELIPLRLTELGEWMDHQRKMNDLIWIPQERFDLSMYSEGIQNQILVKMKNGRYILAPRKITGSSIKLFLGLNYTRTLEWAILHKTKNYSQVNPTFQTSHDFYERYTSILH